MLWAIQKDGLWYTPYGSWSIKEQEQAVFNEYITVVLIAELLDADVVCIEYAEGI